MNIIQAMQDGGLFGDYFGDLASWSAWIVFLRAVYGLPMSDDELQVFRKHTGLPQPRPGGYMEALAITGRQSGKTATGRLITAFESASAVARGERGLFAPMVAQDQRGAQRALFANLLELVRASPSLAAVVTRETATELELAGGAVTCAVYPCRPSALRGIRSAVAVVDELAFFVASDGRPTDHDMLRAIRPTLATTGGRLIILSSPHGQAGALYDLYRRHRGKHDSHVLVWQATAPEMNPTLSVDFLERMAQDDPDAYRSEVLGEFRAGVSTFLDPDALADVVDGGVMERPPEDGAAYFGYVDAASGSGKDAFAVGIAHKAGPRSVLDVVRTWSPPFNPSGAIAEAAELFKRYRVREVSGDRYAPGFVAEGFAQNGVTYRAGKRTTSEIYLEVLPLVNSKTALLLDHARLLRELRGLERTRGAAGRDRIDHRRGEHDDCAVAAAGAVVAAAASERNVVHAVFGTYGTPEPARRGYRMNEQ